MYLPLAHSFLGTTGRRADRKEARAGSRCCRFPSPWLSQLGCRWFCGLLCCEEMVAKDGPRGRMVALAWMGWQAG